MGRVRAGTARAGTARAGTARAGIHAVLGGLVWCVASVMRARKGHERCG
jgi:hypothetical protein